MKSVLPLHLQVQSDEQLRLALTHLHLIQLPLQEHFISLLHAFETSGSLIHTGTQCPDLVISIGSPWQGLLPPFATGIYALLRGNCLCCFLM